MSSRSIQPLLKVILTVQVLIRNKARRGFVKITAQRYKVYKLTQDLKSRATHGLFKLKRSHLSSEVS